MQTVTNLLRTLFGFLFLSCILFAQQPSDSVIGTLEQLSRSVQGVVARVAPAIVRVEVVGYGRPDDYDEDEQSATQVVTKRESVASGIVVDSNGYIVTNAHVVKGARRVQVMLDSRGYSLGPEGVPTSANTTFVARILGAFEGADLALLKIEATGLPVLPIADSNTIQPGQLVFAVGNPEGLNRSVSMGVISAVGRQRDTDSSPVYIQTDAAINPGSSGGALVDIHGNLVGMTSFILTEGGGSEGLGFALPSALVHLIYMELRANGRFEVGNIGLRVQAITPTIASGLRLPRNFGLIVSDVIPGSPADSAGIREQDILLSLDSNSVENPAQYETSFYTKRVGNRVEIKLLRGSHPFVAWVTVQRGSDDYEDLLEQVDIQQSIVKPLGIVATTLNEKTRPEAPVPRSKTGVLVVGKVARSEVHTGLGVGDLIRSVNGVSVQNVESLRSLLQQYRSGDAVVLQIERHGRLRYLSFESD